MSSIAKDIKDININEKIRAREVRLIDDSGAQLGILSIIDAMKLARERELDLVEVSPKANPPVCKIMDYGKFKYQLAKKTQEAKKKQTVIQIKEIKLRLKIEEHDLQFKIKHIKEFLGDGDKVKVTIMFRGREMLHVDMGQQIARKIIDSVKEAGVLENKQHFDGRNIIMVFAPL